MTEYRATRADMNELGDAHDRVVAVRKELAEEEKKVSALRWRLQSAETQLANAIRQVCQGAEDEQEPDQTP